MAIINTYHQPNVTTVSDSPLHKAITTKPFPRLATCVSQWRLGWPPGAEQFPQVDFEPKSWGKSGFGSAFLAANMGVNSGILMGMNDM